MCHHGGYVDGFYGGVSWTFGVGKHAGHRWRLPEGLGWRQAAGAGHCGHCGSAEAAGAL